MTNEIILIIECCRLSQDSKLIEEKISLIKNWDDFISLAYSHGVFPLVYQVLKKHEDKIPLEVFAFMKQSYMNVVKTNMLMTSELIRVSNLLEENGIKAIAFKGPTLSQMAYGDVISRQYVDIDLMVNQNDLLKSVNLLLDNNYINHLPLEIISNKICLNTMKDFTLINNNSKVCLEMHWKFFENRYKELFRDIMIEDNTVITINQNQIKTILKEYLLVYLCYHGSKNIWERIEWIVDIDKLIRNNKLDFSKIDDFFDDTSLQLGLYLSYVLFNTPVEEKYLNIILNNKIEKLAKKVLKLFMDKKYQKNESYQHHEKFNLQVNLHKTFSKKLAYYLKYTFAISPKDCTVFYKTENKYYFIFLRFNRLIKEFCRKIYSNKSI